MGQGWLVFSFGDWNRQADVFRNPRGNERENERPSEDIPCVAFADLPPWERETVRQGAWPHILARAPQRSLESIEDEILELESKIRFLEEHVHALEARHGRRMAEAESDPTEARYWGFRPQLALGAAERIERDLSRLEASLKRLRARRNSAERLLRERVNALDKEIRELFAKSDERRQAAIALDPDVHSRWYGKPHSQGQS